MECLLCQSELCDAGSSVSRSFRRIRQLKDSGAWTLRHNLGGALNCWRPELWKPLGDLVMSESGHNHWRKAMMTQPVLCLLARYGLRLERQDSGIDHVSMCGGCTVG